MATQPKVESSGGLEDIIKLFASSNNIFGSGKTTTKESGGTSTQSSSLSPGSEEQSNALLQKIFGDASGANIDNIIGDIFTKARDAMGPNVMASLGAGNRAMSDTSLALIQSQAVARATGEAAKAKLDALNTANNTASKLVEAKMDATKTTSITRPDTSKSTVTGASPSGKGLTALGAISSASKVFNIGKKAKDFYDARESGQMSDDYSQQLTDAFNSGGQASAENNIPLDAFGPGGTDAPNLTLENAVNQNAITDTIPDPLTEEAANALNEAFGSNSNTAANTAALSTTEGIDPVIMTSLQSQGVTPAMLSRATSNAEAEGGNLVPVRDAEGNVTGFKNSETGESIDLSGGDTATEGASISGEEGSNYLVGGGNDTLAATSTGEGTNLAATDSVGSGTAGGVGAAGLGFGAIDILSGGGISEGEREVTSEGTDSNLSFTSYIRENTDPGAIVVPNTDIGLGGNNGEESSIASFVDDSVNNPSVICTESAVQGLLSEKLFLQEYKINSIRITKETLYGYHFIAMPIVLKMRKDKNFAQVMAKFANAYCNHIVGNWNILGFLIKNIGEPICTFVGHFIPEQPISEILYD